MMKRLACAVLALAMVLTLGACASKKSPYDGTWKAISGEMGGFPMEPADIQEIFGGDVSMEFKSGGSCALNFGTDKYDGKWTVDNGSVDITCQDTEIKGTITGNEMVLNDVLGLGMTLNFTKDGAAASSSAAPAATAASGASADTETSVQAKWNGTWYGYFWVTDAQGQWSNMADIFDDAYMVINVDANGEGTMYICPTDTTDKRTVDAKIKADDSHFEVTDGVFWDMQLDPTVWWIAPSPTNSGTLVVISDTYTDPTLTKDDNFTYMFNFHPYGETWDDEVKAGDKLPPDYDKYVSDVKSGVTDPISGGALAGGLSSGGASVGGSTSGASAAGTANAGFSASAFTGATTTYTASGVTVTYPSSIEAKANAMGAAEVDFTDETWLVAYKNDYIPMEMDAMKEYYEGYKDRKDFKLYESTYNGAPCLVVYYATDDNGSASIEITIYPDDKASCVTINVSTMGDMDLADMFGNADLMATLTSVTW